MSECVELRGIFGIQMGRSLESRLSAVYKTARELTIGLLITGGGTRMGKKDYKKSFFIWLVCLFPFF